MRQLLKARNAQHYGKTNHGFCTKLMSRTQVQLWYKRFKESREHVNNDACPSHPTMSTTDENIEAVKKMILNNRRITIKRVADDVDILLAKQL